MIIDATYFVNGDLYIPNANDGNAGSAIETDLDAIITRYERSLLLDALGTDLYNQLVTAMSDLPNAAQKWKDLVNGADYTVDGELLRWDGLKGKNKDGLLAHYVYCKYLSNDEAQYSTTGMGFGTVENTERASYRDKYVKSWSAFLEKYQGENGVNRSLKQYMEDNESDFPYDGFREYVSVNRFGI